MEVVYHYGAGGELLTVCMWVQCGSRVILIWAQQRSEKESEKEIKAEVDLRECVNRTRGVDYEKAE